MKSDEEKQALLDCVGTLIELARDQAKTLPNQSEGDVTSCLAGALVVWAKANDQNLTEALGSVNKAWAHFQVTTE